MSSGMLVETYTRLRQFMECVDLTGTFMIHERGGGWIHVTTANNCRDNWKKTKCPRGYQIPTESND